MAAIARPCYFRGSVYFIHIDSRKVIAAIQAAGWKHVATNGSHWQFKHPLHFGQVTVPHPKRNLPIGMLRSIEKQAGVKLR
jgi:predicted RNA binding protein YcfA (HicA-like mRNA interferase family)